MILMDILGSLLSYKFKNPNIQAVLMIQLAFVLYEKDHQADHCSDVAEYDYAKKDYNECMEGMIEKLNYKNILVLR